MRRWIPYGLLITALAVVGCADDDGAQPGNGGSGGAAGMAGAGGAGGSGGTNAFTWPPTATVHFDQYGIMSADCATDEDCTMALGYYHARDRFVQMEVRRRFTTGRLSDVVNAGLLSESLREGLINLSVDNRALFSTRMGQPGEAFLVQQATPKTRALLDAYAVGVNQWIEDVRNGANGAEWPAELAGGLIAYTPEDAPPWTPEDSIGTVLALIESLTNDEGSHFSAANARMAINDDTRFSDLWSREPINKSTIIEPEEYTPPFALQSNTKRFAPVNFDLMRRAQPALRRLHTRFERNEALRRMVLPSLGRQQDIGSNNWVLGPSVSDSGNALLCNDPHLGFTQPAIWYVAHLDAKTNGTGDIHTAGATFAGLPWVILGQNEDIAWGATNTGLDFSDVYVEELVEDGSGEPMGVMFDGAVVPFTRVDFTLNFSDGSTEEREMLFVPHHGAVRDIDQDNDIAITLRWTGNDVDTDINFLTEMSVASTVQEARTAIQNVTSIGQNWVVIDDQGNFGWFPYNRLPKRTWATNVAGGAAPWLPLDGTGAFEWDEYFDLNELPQTFNRAAGYLATANNDFIGALFDGDSTNDGHAPFQADAAAGYRHARIVDLIEAQNDHTPATMLATIGDVYSLIGEDMTQAIVDIAEDDMTTLSASAQRVVNALNAWDYSCPTGLDGTNQTMSPLTSDSDELLAASGCAAFHVALEEIETELAGDESSPGFPNFVTYFSLLDPSELAAGDVYWDNIGTMAMETKYDIIALALDNAGTFLDAELGTDETQWAWGRLHAMRLTSDLASLSDLFAPFNNPPPNEPLFANDGGLYTVDVANPRGDFSVGSGPSMRFCCEALPANVACTIQVPGGQSGDVMSPNYDDLLDLWLTNTPVDVVFDNTQAAMDAVETITLGQ